MGQQPPHNGCWEQHLRVPLRPCQAPCSRAQPLSMGGRQVLHKPAGLRAGLGERSRQGAPQAAAGRGHKRPLSFRQRQAGEDEIRKERLHLLATLGELLQRRQRWSSGQQAAYGIHVPVVNCQPQGTLPTVVENLRGFRRCCQQQLGCCSARGALCGTVQRCATAYIHSRRRLGCCCKQQLG